MYIGVRGGHNPQAKGAIGLIDEELEDRKVYPVVIKYLEIAGDTVLDCTPPDSDEMEDLVYGTNKANNAKVDLYLPIHFNSTVGTVAGRIGSECWINPKNPTGIAIGDRIVAKLAGLGFESRGLKDGATGEHLHDILTTNMTSCLVEVCFVDSIADVALYHKLGVDVIGHAIAEGIVGHSIVKPVVIAPVEKKAVPVAVKVAPEVKKAVANVIVPVPKTFDLTIPIEANITPFNGGIGYIESLKDSGRVILHLDRNTYISMENVGEESQITLQTRQGITRLDTAK